NPNPLPPQNFVSVVRVMNNTNVRLRKLSGSDFLSAGTFVKKPDDTIPPHTPIVFSVNSQKNLNDGIEEVVGTVTCEPEGARKGESWQIVFERTSKDKNGRAQQDLKNTQRFAPDPADATGNNFSFGLSPNGQPKQGFESRVIVRNNTGVALTKVDADAKPGK